MKETKAWLLRKSFCFFACSKRAGVLLSVSMSLNESVIYFKFRERMPKMKKRIYLAKANHKTANHENQTNASGKKENHRLTEQTKEQLLEISGSEFYRIVSASNVENMEPRYFIRLTDDIDYECPEIFVEVSKNDYTEWKREYNLHLYRRRMKSCYVEVPFDDALLFLYSKAEEDSETLPEKMAEKRENLDKLQNAFASLTDEEKELIWLLYLCKEPLTETQVASVLHISQPAVHKRKKRILEKMRSFWL